MTGITINDGSKTQEMYEFLIKKIQKNLQSETIDSLSIQEVHRKLFQNHIWFIVCFSLQILNIFFGNMYD